MTQAPENLPKFKKPPVVEVLLGVQFAQLSGMHIGHYGLIWEKFKEKFPRLEPQMPFPHVIERKGVHAPAPPSFSLLSPSRLMHRIWLISENTSDLVQVQSDRFMRNWRRYHNDNIPYPSYEKHNRPGFVTDFDTLQKFTAEQNLGPVAVDQCEMTYINHIKPCGVWSNFSQLNRVFKGWPADYPHLAGVEPGIVGCTARHELSDSKGGFVGYLYVQMDSAFSLLEEPVSDEPAPILQLQLTVRGRPLGEGSEGVMQFMDMAHSTIVKSFAEVTTPEMHAIWKRIQ